MKTPITYLYVNRKNDIVYYINNNNLLIDKPIDLSFYVWKLVLNIILS